MIDVGGDGAIYVLNHGTTGILLLSLRQIEGASVPVRPLCTKPKRSENGHPHHPTHERVHRGDALNKQSSRGHTSKYRDYQ